MARERAPRGAGEPRHRRLAHSHRHRPLREGGEPGEGEHPDGDPQPGQPPSRGEHERESAEEHERAGERGPGQEGGVARADQDAVEHEHNPGDRLEGRGDQQHRHQRVRDGAVGGEHRGEHGAERGQADAGNHAEAEPPPVHPRHHPPGRLDASGAQPVAYQRLRGDSQGVEGEGARRAPHAR